MAINVDNFIISHSAEYDLMSGNKNLIHKSILQYIHRKTGEFETIADVELIDEDRNSATLLMIFTLGKMIMELRGDNYE